MGKRKQRNGPAAARAPAADGESASRTDLALAAIRAIAPLVDLFLELGITSPEAESLWRGVFVHRTRQWLARKEGGKMPSDVRIALVSGVHRNFVSGLLAEPPKISAVKQRKGHPAKRLLDAWHQDTAYLDSVGRPRDLPEQGPAPSFEALAGSQVPGTPFRFLLGELHRAGAVELLADRRVRVRTRNLRLPGVNLENLSEIGRRSAAYLQTQIHNLKEPTDQLLNESLSSIHVAPHRAAVVRDVIYRRALSFLQSLEAELASERRKIKSSHGLENLSIIAFAARGAAHGTEKKDEEDNFCDAGYG